MVFNFMEQRVPMGSFFKGIFDLVCMQNKQNLNHFYGDTGLDSLAFSDVILSNWYLSEAIFVLE